MHDYILRLSDRSDSLAHTQRKGAHWGVVTRNVGKYYIPKGEKGHARAEKRYEKEREKLGRDAEAQVKRYSDNIRGLNEKLASGKINEDQFKEKAQKISDKYKRDRDKLERRADNLDHMGKRLESDRSTAIRDRKLSDLTDEELSKLKDRTNSERIIYNNLEKIRNAEKKDDNDDSLNFDNRAKARSNMVNAAKGINSTISSISESYRKNPPMKKAPQTDLSELSDTDIRKAIDRKRLEQQYHDVVDTPTVDTGKLRAAAALSAVGTLLVVGTQAVDLAMNVKELTK